MSQLVSRRVFGRFAAIIPFASEHAFAQLSALGEIPSDAVRINANENPLGPCPEALEAMQSVIRDSGRYHFQEGGKLASLIAEIEGLRLDSVRAFAGSSDPLHRAVMAFTSASKPFVMASPGYEAGGFTAQALGAQSIEVPLTKSYAHDVRAMAAKTEAGLFYICNPNNPSGTTTPREEIEWLLANKPAGSIVLIDEAYIHLAKKAETCADLVAKDKDVIILRTFSKLYGMAGVRAGAALGRPDLLHKIGMYGAGMVPVAGMVGAQASLRAKDLVATRRKINAEVRDQTLEFLDKHKFAFVPSDSNKFMVDVKRPGGEVIRALAQQKVYVGRVWPAWPTHVRVSVGTKPEMERFQTAFLKVMS